MRFFLLFSIAILLQGCGYHLGRGGILENYQTISIPYVEGDETGYLTSALVREVSSRSPLRYSYCGGDCELKVALLEEDSENIGFRFAPGSQPNRPSKIIVAEEARLILKACVTLIDRRNGKILIGPMEVIQSLTFDFEPDFTNLNFHAFSLGQLEMYPQAKDAADFSLDSLLAQKIVDSLNFCW